MSTTCKAQNKATAKQIHRFHALLAKNNLMEGKRGILAGEGVESTKDLTEQQINGLIIWLDDKLNGRPQKPTYRPDPISEDQSYALFDKGNRQHRYLLSMCQQLGWVIWDETRNRYLADLARLGAWIRTRTESKKPLLSQNELELQRTIYAFEQMLSKQFTSK